MDEQRISGVKLGDDHSIAADLIVADGRNYSAASKLGSRATVLTDILWFKLADSPRFEAENVFVNSYGRHGFGLFSGRRAISRWAGRSMRMPHRLEAASRWSELCLAAPFHVMGINPAQISFTQRGNGSTR